MKRRKVILIVSIAVPFLLLYFYVQYNGGIRTTPLAAAQAHFSVGTHATVFDQMDLTWGRVYLMDTPNGERTAIVRKRGPYWECRFVAALDRNETSESEPIRTVGMLNFQYGGVTPPESVALIAISVRDPSVAYIEAGVGSDRIRKGIDTNNYVMISWPKVFPEANLKPVALSSDGRPLYEYRYAQENHTDPKTLKWYPVH